MTDHKGVNEVCREWVVREDNALAYQLQQLEVEQHYSGNKSRNAIVREDVRVAKDAQRRVQEEAFEILKRKALREERDAQIAREIAEKFEREEREKLRRIELDDQRIAKRIQEKGDFNSVGLPIATQDDWPPPPPPELDKINQEKLDEELAKRLQLEEETLSHLDRDRLLAIEVQDTELAKMLYQKEKAKAKKVREKAKEKALLKKQLEEEMLAAQGLPIPVAGLPVAPHGLPMAAHGLPSSLPPPTPTLLHNGSHLPNIAMAIDPTYVSPPKNVKTNGLNQPPPTLLLHPDILGIEEAPPYMPVQGQKRTPQDKKKKK